MAEERNIKYINKDFNDFRSQLIEYAKNYFPNTYNDFSPTSPGMMFMEMAAYVGDVLSFYQDTQLQETYLNYAKDPRNLYSLAYMMGYRPKTTGISTVDLEITQLIESTGTPNYLPNWEQAAVITENAVYTSTDKSQTKFLVDQRVDFSFSSSYNPTEVTIDSLDGSDNPEIYKLKKKVKAFSSEIKETTFTVDNTDKFKTFTLQDTNIVGILDIYDGPNQTGNKWYEVPFLGQDTIFEDEANSATDSNRVPWLLKLKKVPYRFVSRFLSTGYLQLQFGAGTNSQDDSQIIPDPSNVGLSTNQGLSRIDYAYDPSNFLYSKSYGIAPSSGTTLYVRYLKGGGISSNIPANTLTTAGSGNTITSAGNDSSRLSSDYISYNNLIPAEGGRDGDSVEEIRQNSLRAFNEQSRTVTLQDYSVRALSLPSKYGSIAKAFVTQDNLTNTNLSTNNLLDSNPLSISLYVKAYDNNKKLVDASTNLKTNLKTYLSEYIMLTDAVNIKDAFVVNIGINYDIVTRPNYSGRDVILGCNNKLKELFDITKWNINQPINLAYLRTELDKVKGVQTVQKIEIINKTGNNYSPYAYDVKGAVRNDIVYPSYDPCIFEVKFPDIDIKGRVTTL